MSKSRTNLMVAAAAGLSLCLTTLALAQARPSPRDPATRAQPERGQARQAPGARTAPDAGGAQFPDIRIIENESERDPVLRRRESPPEKTALGFRDADVEQTIPFIAEMTGKTVIPVNLAMLRATKITLVNDELIDRMVALDLLFNTFRLNGIGVIEREDVIIIAQSDMLPQIGRFPVLTGRDNVMARHDLGSTVIKVFPLRNANAEMVGDRIMEVIPNISLAVDVNSNQIVVLGDIGLCQQIQLLINELDWNFIEEETRTYYLKHADALEVMDNILDLYPEQTAQQQQRRGQQRPTRPGQPAARPGQQQQQPSQIGPVVQIRITPIIPQNALTITAKPSIVKEVGNLIERQWDLPRPFGTSKVYTLKFTDAVAMAAKLQSLLGQGSPTQAGRTGGAVGGQRTDVGQIVSGIYSIEPYPEHNRLIVLSKTEESFEFLDQLIDQLDQRSEAGLPVIIELKHADAVALAEELNALLQEAGGGVNIPAPQRGLTGQSVTDGGGGGMRNGGGAVGTGGQAGGGTAGRINFPWQQRPREGRGPESPIIGQARIMPIVRQNAIAIVAAPAHQAALRDIVEMLDRPGRQVLIAATVAEVEVSDALAWGLRMGGPGIAPRFPDNLIGGTISAEAVRDPLFTGNLFTSSVLDVNFSVTAFLQALSRDSRVRVLQSPKIFTSDNKEAQFFDGSVVPFLNTSQVTDIGTTIQSFDREAVGVRLNVRPRITVHGDVDLELVLELSRIRPGTEDREGGVIIDRRETTTQVIIKNGQTILLSGILRDEESDVVRKIPILGDIPIIGPILFSSKDKEQSQAELIAFITPIIVDNPADNDENFNIHERERLRELSAPLRSRRQEGRIIRDRVADPAGAGMPAPERPAIEPELSIFDPRDLMEH